MEMELRQRTKYTVAYAIYVLLIMGVTFFIILCVEIKPYETEKFLKILWAFLLCGLCWGAEDIVGFFISRYEEIPIIPK